jgi:lipid-binding SYLF domain-containing protein
MQLVRNSIFTIILFSSFSIVTNAQNGSKDEKIISDAKQARKDFIQTDANIQELLENAYGYVIFPNVGKGGIGIGGAAGNGVAFRDDQIIGMAKMTQLTVGFQWGGQAYREVILFETEDAFNDFKNNRVELSAQASAVALKSGASANAKYKDGVMIFTQTKGGLMYEASIGGQKFKFREL